MQAKGPRRKGSRIERELVKRHEEAGIPCLRVPLSGAQSGWEGDLRVGEFRVEVKARRNGSGFAVLAKWLGDNDLLMLRRDRTDAFVAMPWSTYTRLMRAYLAEQGGLPCDPSSESEPQS